MPLELVRDELPACSGSANREFVASAFLRCGASFENPTKAGIVAAVEECKRNAEAAMGPRGGEVIREHYAVMAKLLERLPG